MIVAFWPYARTIMGD